MTDGATNRLVTGVTFENWQIKSPSTKIAGKYRKICSEIRDKLLQTKLSTKFLPRNVLGCKLFFNNNTWTIWYPKQASHTLRLIRRWTGFITFSSLYYSPMPCAPRCNPARIAQCLAQNLAWSDFLVRGVDPWWNTKPSASQVLPSSASPPRDCQERSVSLLTHHPEGCYNWVQDLNGHLSVDQNEYIALRA